ncbi:hypothetical protein GQ600_5743 [Phytophthora cactorum]|nr:hypothetical protein GQ600_5743 [Phytophthora cactorum]
MVFSRTQDLTARFINAVLDQVIRLGASFQGNFKKAIWNRIVRDFNTAFRRPNTRPSFGWDPSTDMPTAPDSVLEDVIAAHPQAREFRTRPLFMYSELDTILSQTAATGSFAVYNEEVNMFTDKIPVDQRFRFIKLLATEPNAATMFYGMDDESREYMVRQYLLADNSDSDDN